MREHSSNCYTLYLYLLTVNCLDIGIICHFFCYVPQDPSPVSKLLRFSLTPIRDIERVTGVDFFPTLSPQQQNTLELRITNRLWTTDQ